MNQGLTYTRDRLIHEIDLFKNTYAVKCHLFCLQLFPPSQHYLFNFLSSFDFLLISCLFSFFFSVHSSHSSFFIFSFFPFFPFRFPLLQLFSLFSFGNSSHFPSLSFTSYHFLFSLSLSLSLSPHLLCYPNSILPFLSISSHFPLYSDCCLYRSSHLRITAFYTANFYYPPCNRHLPPLQMTFIFIFCR